LGNEGFAFIEISTNASYNKIIIYFQHVKVLRMWNLWILSGSLSSKRLS